jgi:3D (Asp-Asp-Asp) domain-containing protein
MFLGGVGYSKWLGVILLMYAMVGVSGSVSSFVMIETVDTRSVPLPNWQIAWQQAQYRVPAQYNSSESDSESANVIKSQQSRMSYKLSPDSHHDLTKCRTVEVTATGYFAGVESTGKKPSHPEYGVTFSGMKVVRNERALSTIAADPEVFPLGTVMYIPGYGYGIVADTGSAIKGKKIDLYFETKGQIYSEWGKHQLTIYVVKQGSGTLNRTIWNEYMHELFPWEAERTVNGISK